MCICVGLFFFYQQCLSSYRRHNIIHEMTKLIMSLISYLVLQIVILVYFNSFIIFGFNLVLQSFKKV